MAANDPGTYVDTPGGRMQAVALFYWNGTAYVASSGGARLINAPVASVGNGADTTEDTLQTFSIPAGILRSVGDRIRIIAGGTLAATTDNKTVRIKIGAATVGQISLASASTVAWRGDIEVAKIAANSQRYSSFMVGHAATGTVQSTTMSLTEDNANTLLVTGQNNTNSSAGSITCNYLSVQYTPV